MRLVVSSLLCVGLVAGGISNGAEPEQKAVSKPSNVSARMENLEAGKESRLFIYSEHPIRNVYVWLPVSKRWEAMAFTRQIKGHSAYRSSTPLTINDRGITWVRATYSNNVRFTDKVVGEVSDGKIKLHLQEDTREQVAPDPVIPPEDLLTHQELLFGASHLHPQVLAQARVNYMAQRGMSGHMGSGVVMTSAGQLCEGWGMGSSSQPHTCYGAGAPLADATARMANGQTQRIRFYYGATHP